MSVINRNSGSAVYDTFADALLGNMRVGQLCITKGQVTSTDGIGGQYEVKASGSGGVAMANGNELVILDGETLKPPSIADLPPITKVGQKISVTGYHPSTTVGGGELVGVELARHDGVLYFDPNRAAEIGTAAYYVDSGSDAACWARVINGGVFLSSFAGDLTASSLRAFASVGIAAGYKHLKVNPGSYVVEADNNDPGTGDVNSNVLLLNGESDILIDMQGVVINQVTTDSVGGFIQLHDCQSCGVVGGKMNGVYNSGTGQTTNSLCIISGESNLCYSVDGEVVGGRALTTLRSSDGTPTGTKPTESVVRGKFKDTEYAVNYTHCGYGHKIDVVGENVLRVAYITGTSGIEGGLVCKGAKGAALNISTRNGADIKDINLNVEFDECNVPIRFRVEDGTPATLKHIKISGSVTASVNSPADGVSIQGSSGASIYDDIDLSGLSVKVVGGNSGVLITGGDASQVISNVVLPRFSESDAQYGLEIDNTVLATIKNISAPRGAVYKYSGTGNVHAVDCQKGLVENLDLSGAIIDASSGSSTFAAFIYEVDGLNLDDVQAPGGLEVLARINTNYVTAKRLTHLGFVYGEKTNVSGSFTALGLDVAYLSGTGNITQFKRCIKGQKIKLVSTGSTQTVVHSASIVLAGGVDFTFSNNDILELECITGGESSIFIEANRSVNG